MTGADAADRVLEAADAAGAPLSGLARVLMHHEASLDVTVPRWVAGRVVCAARRWDVTVAVAAAWLLAEGTARLIATAEADRLDLLTDKMPGLAINPEDAQDCRQLRVTPGAELLVPLGWLSKLADARLQDVAAVGLVWGLTRLHDTDDGHDCTTADDIEAAYRHAASVVNPHEAAVLAEGTARLIATAEADRLDLLTDKMPGLAINPEDAQDCRQLRVPTPGAELLVPLGWLSKLADARLQDVAAVGLVWGLTRLHDTDDGHDCTTAEGTARLIATAEADRLDLLTYKMPGLAINPEDAQDCRQLRVPTPGAELLVALGWLSKLADARLRDVAAVGLVWGLTRLHDTDDGHDCTTADDIEAAYRHAASIVNPHEAAVLAEAPIGLLALSMLAPNQIFDIALPEFVDDWLVCIAGRWNTTESTAAAWLRAEGTGYLYALEHNGRTDWRTGATRWVIPTEVPKGPRRLIEVCGESLQTTVAYLASRRGDDQTGIITLTIAVGARL